MQSDFLQLESTLVFVQRSLNANRYIENKLEPALLPYLNGLWYPSFQQDNIRPLAPTITRQFFDRIQVILLPWLSRSSDLSPIE
jgi:hypothetical protein